MTKYHCITVLRLYYMYNELKLVDAEAVEFIVQC